MKKFLFIFFLSMACSCVQLELSPEDDTSDRTKISFRVNWGELEEASRPDSTFIALNNISEEIHYLFETDSEGNYLPDNHHDSSAFYGSYVMLAYYCDKDNYILSGTKNFLSDNAVSVRDFKARVKDLPEGELEEFKAGSKLDFNSAYRFIRTPGPVWAAFAKNVVSDTRENLFHFTMTPLQQTITFSIKLTPADGVSIHSVLAELSGVPASFSLLTGEVNEEDLARVFFKMNPSDGGFEGTVAVPAVLPSENNRLRTGPGILRLSITAEKDGVSRILYPAVNIGDKIVELSLLETIPGTDGRRIARRQVRMELDEKLEIGSDSFSSTGGDDGVTDWFDSGVIDVEV